MTKKPITSAEIDGLHKTLSTLGIRLIRANSGGLYLAVSQTGKPGGNLELHLYDLPEATEEIKWVLRDNRKFPNEALIAEALKGLVRKTKKSLPEMVSRRVAERGDKLYVDLCDPERRVVEITADGWRVLQDAPVNFYRPPEALPLPVPIQGGSIQRLRELLGILDESSWILALGWLSTALKEWCDHPFLALSGPPGSGKSSVTKLLYHTKSD